GYEYKFTYSFYIDYMLHYDGETIIFNITTLGNEDKRGFSFKLKVMENGIDLKVVDMYSDLEKKYLGKGISIAMILHVKSIFNKRIISSTNIQTYKCHIGESNSQDAIDKVWERMRKNEDAGYNEIEGYYYTK
ncbi:MAG: hypothetical protein AAGA77_19095, partial [Bacteroidota bacterium]